MVISGLAIYFSHNPNSSTLLSKNLVEVSPGISFQTPPWRNRCINYQSFLQIIILKQNGPFARKISKTPNISSNFIILHWFRFVYFVKSIWLKVVNLYKLKKGKWNVFNYLNSWLTCHVGGASAASNMDRVSWKYCK